MRMKTEKELYESMTREKLEKQKKAALVLLQACGSEVVKRETEHSLYLIKQVIKEREGN